MILVTGGAGYIGSIILQALREHSLEHLVLDTFEKGKVAALRGSPYVQGDIRLLEDLRRVFHEHPIDLVMHLAAYVSVTDSLVNPDRHYVNNAIGTFNVLEAMRQAGVAKIVFSSTAAVYGLPQRLPMDEDHPREPTNPYGRSKVAAEHLLASYSQDYGIRHVALRYFNAAGAEPDAGLGPSRDLKEDLISLAMRVAVGDDPLLRVYGTDYSTPDGTCIRDFVHVRDLADAHIRAADYLGRGGASRVFNLGTGHGFSVREVLREVERQTGRKLPTEDAPRRAGDPELVLASAQRAEGELGWRPQRSTLERMIGDTWRFTQTLGS